MLFSRRASTLGQGPPCNLQTPSVAFNFVFWNLLQIGSRRHIALHKVDCINDITPPPNLWTFRASCAPSGSSLYFTAQLQSGALLTVQEYLDSRSESSTLAPPRSEIQLILQDLSPSLLSGAFTTHKTNSLLQIPKTLVHTHCLTSLVVLYCFPLPLFIHVGLVSTCFRFFLTDTPWSCPSFPGAPRGCVLCCLLKRDIRPLKFYLKCCLEDANADVLKNGSEMCTNSKCHVNAHILCWV